MKINTYLTLSFLLLFIVNCTSTRLLFKDNFNSADEPAGFRGLPNLNPPGEPEGDSISLVPAGNHGVSLSNINYTPNVGTNSYSLSFLSASGLPKNGVELNFSERVRQDKKLWVSFDFQRNKGSNDDFTKTSSFVVKLGGAFEIKQREDKIYIMRSGAEREIARYTNNRKKIIAFVDGERRKVNLAILTPSIPNSTQFFRDLQFSNSSGILTQLEMYFEYSRPHPNRSGEGAIVDNILISKEAIPGMPE